MSKTVTVPLSVNLRQETYDALTRGVRDVSPSDVLSTKAQQFLENWADGAVVLKTEDVQKIEESTKKPITNAKDVVAAALKGVGIEDGKAVFVLQLDPSYVEPLEMQAQESSCTVNELMSYVINQAIENQWVFGVTVEGTRRTFTPRQEKFFAKIAGKQDFTIEDIERGIKAVLKAAREPEAIPA